MEKGKYEVEEDEEEEEEGKESAYNGMLNLKAVQAEQRPVFCLETTVGPDKNEIKISQQHTVCKHRDKYTHSLIPTDTENRNSLAIGT